MMVAKETTMVTKTKTAASKTPAAPAKRSASRKLAMAAPTPTPSAPVPGLEAAAPLGPAAEPGKPNLLRAGLKALGNVRDDVVQHQSRVFEAILGIEPGKGWPGMVKRDLGAAKAAKAAQDAFGLRKFEAVFDQRVVSALERMGWPPVDTLKALVDRVAVLADQVAALGDEVATLRAELRGRKGAARKR